MTARHQRLLVVVGIVVGTGIGVTVALKAFSGNLLYYYTPTQVLTQDPRPHQVFRLGGLVEKDTVKHVPGSLTVRFVVTDNHRSIPVIFTGILPDLFRPGQGVIANGHMGPGGVFVADKILAKHGSKYMPLKLYNKENDTAYKEPGAMNEGGVAYAGGGDGA